MKQDSGNINGRAYSTAKIAHHPEALRAIRLGARQPPIFVHWFPTNVCNHACDFCAYGHWRPEVPNPAPSKWKNHQVFRERDAMPEAKMLETVECLAALGVKAVEITGGGEPTTYPFFDAMVRAIGNAGMDVALVSNGVLLNQARTDLLGQVPYTWARISIDAGTQEEYCATRHAPRSHWDKAWDAVRRLAEQKHHPEARVGVGYVVDRANSRGVYQACKRAKDCGADNVRVSASFTPEQARRWHEQIHEAHQEAERARAELEDDAFTVYNLAAERAQNMATGTQQYPYCYWKDIGCVIGADQNVYACCSWAYNKAGLMGTIRDKTFEEMWYGEAAKFRRGHDPRHDCPIGCLYEGRNKQALRIITDPDLELAERADEVHRPLHCNFV